MEVRFLRHCAICLLIGSSLASCLRDDPVEGTGGGNGTSPEATIYTLGTPVSFNTGLDGLSAICLNETDDGLLVARDNGNVLEFGLDGTLRQTNAMPNPDERDKVDLEGITKASDGSIFLCEERFHEVWKLNANHKGMTLVSTGPTEPGNEANQGFEGVAAGPDGMLYVANQSKPFRVYSYSTKINKWETAFDVTWAESLSDIFYDEDDGTLWITDAKTQKLTQVKTDGTVLGNIDISFVKKPEGFCKDRTRKLFWFVCDKNKTIHKVSYQ